MNADGQRFHLVLGRADWARCTVLDEQQQPEALAAAWTRETASPPKLPLATAPVWDAGRNQIALSLAPEVLPMASGEALLDPSARRSAASDSNGNIYWIGADRTQLWVQSAGDGSASPFWPDKRVRPERRSQFADVVPPVLDLPAYDALAVTCDGWLVAAGGHGCDAFDLVAGGPPLHQRWPTSFAPRPTSLVPRGDAGVWLLDSAAARLYPLGRTLQLPAEPAATAVDLFHAPGEAPRARSLSRPTSGIDLAALFPGIAPVAMAALRDGSLAILSRAPDRLCLYVPGTDHQPDWLTLDFVPHDVGAGLVHLRGGIREERIVVSGSNPACLHSFRVLDGGRPVLDPQPEETLPMRRHGGLALTTVQGIASYDSGPVPRWLPVVERPRRRYRPVAELITPLFDSATPGTIWDRLHLDGCVPAGAQIEVAARFGEAPEKLGSWIVQPTPLLNPAGPELAWHSAAALPATDATQRQGTFELLLQRSAGRYVQLRIALTGNGDASPHLRALRVSWPRTSWVQRYLPAIYREETEPADFLERFLANLQGTTNGIEERIAAAQALFDTRTAPADALPWLAEWFDVALEPGWDERRRRTFLASAVRFFGWRGTMRGLEAALALAFDGDLSSTLFGDGDCTCESAIRIVEAWRTRGATEEGSSLAAGLAERQRWQDFLKQRHASDAPAPMQDLPFLEVPPAHAADWQTLLALPGHDRALWQRFLRGRYRRIRELNRAHSAQWQDFGEVSLFDRTPPTAAAGADWADFTGTLLRIDDKAHRFAVLLPVGPADPTDIASLDARRRLAERIIALEKPAHTVFEVRFYFAMNRIGEARLGHDTTLGSGSRSPETLPPAVLGRAYIGESFLGPDGTTPPPDRARLAC